MTCSYCGLVGEIPLMSVVDMQKHIGDCAIKYAARVDKTFTGDKALDHLKAAAVCPKACALDCCRPTNHAGDCTPRRNASPFPDERKHGVLTNLHNANPDRVPVDYRYDLLDFDFLQAMAELLGFGSVKYADYGYVHMGAEAMSGDKSPVNHIEAHTRQYVQGELHKHFKDRAHQLAAIAVNAMMEYHFLMGDENRSISPLSRTKGELGK